MPRCAVIYNPIKVSTQFLDALESRLSEAGWVDTLWLETSEDDPGHSMTRRAVNEQVDLAIGAGGDGTIRVVAHELADSGIPMGIVAAGTANLLARNLGLPLKEAEAIDVALTRQLRKIDLVKLTVDDGEPEHFAVMAGVGVDAMIMDETDPKLKSTVGPAAYFIAAGKALGRLPMHVEIRVDGHRRHRRHRAMIVVIGNVSDLPGNITLIKGAEPDDGLLDVFVASPHRITQWIRLLIRLITRRGHSQDQVDQWVGQQVVVELRKPETYQLDGDVVGEGRRLVAEVAPAALQVCVATPAEPEASAAADDPARVVAPVDTSPAPVG